MYRTTLQITKLNGPSFYATLCPGPAICENIRMSRHVAHALRGPVWV